VYSLRRQARIPARTMISTKGVAMKPERLASEDVIINAPLSYAGSAQRVFRLRRRGKQPWSLALLTIAAILLIVAAWIVVTGWYAVTVGLLFFITVPFRLLRRGGRKRRAERFRHREMLSAIERER
jgi:Flp pilus assembly protein TadB